MREEIRIWLEQIRAIDIRTEPIPRLREELKTLNAYRSRLEEAIGDDEELSCLIDWLLMFRSGIEFEIQQREEISV